MPAVSAVLLILSFPGFNIWIFAWVAFVPLFFALDGQNPLAAFLRAYLTGFLFFLGTMYWLIHVTLPGTLTVVAYLALYFGLFGLIISLITPTRCNYTASVYGRLFFVPSVWTALEWLRSHALTGFGWNLLGYSQSLNLPAIQIADMTGPYGPGFAVMMFSVAVYMFVRDFKREKNAYIPVAAATITILAVFGYGLLRMNNVFTGEKLRVALVQGNIPQDQKWDRRCVDMIMSRYEDLTRKAAAKKPDIIIWPETSIPGFVENEEDLSGRVEALVKETGLPVLAGSPRYKDAADGTSYYNSAFLFMNDGSVGGLYDKVHLVPFGEYVPLKGLFFFVHKFAPRPIGDFRSGKEFTVFRFPMKRASRNDNYSWKMVKRVAFSSLICFEDIFPGLARRFTAKGIDFLVNITNDGWFGRSAAAYQHAQASIFRAVENRINVLRAANTGLSCFIDQKGRIAGRVSDGGRDLFVPGFVTGEIVLSRTKTLYMAYGDIFAYACIAFAALYLAAIYRSRR